MKLTRLITAAACAIAVVGVAAPAAATASPAISLAAAGKTGVISDIACPSPRSCWAVGNGIRPNSTFVARLMHFNGKTWTTLNVAVPPAMTSVHGQPTGDDPLNGISCTSTSNCWAVGYTRAGDFLSWRNRALHWDGRHWADVTIPTPHGFSGDLLSVACANASSCWAVGTLSNDPQTATGQTLHWNGKSWRAVHTPPSYALVQVRCERGQCWSAGELYTRDADPARARKAVLLHLVAGKWVSSLPFIPGSSLSSVSCPSADDCWLSGIVNNIFSLSHWDGTTLTPATLPGAPQGGGFVSCSSAASCWFSGSQEKSAHMYHWNGTAWTAFASPTVHQGRIEHVTCASSTFCWASGLQGSGYHYNVVLLRWNGRHWVRSL